MRAAPAAAAALALAGCLPTVDLPRPASEPKLDPIAFFTGPSEGRGTLSTAIGGRQTIRVTSRGTLQRDGSLVLDQRIETSGEAARNRRWIMRPQGEGRYGGTLTEAIGEVDARVSGNRMAIAYETKSYRVRQQLVLGRDGAVHNRLDVIKWGLNVARLSETIVRK